MSEPLNFLVPVLRKLPPAVQELLFSKYGTGILLALVCVLIGTVFLVFQALGSFTSNNKRHSQPTIIIAGPQGAGKTALYTLLTNGKAVETVTSQQQNVYNSFSIPFDSDTDATHITLIDIPGHPKLFQRFDQTIATHSNIKGILFVVDAADCTPKGLEKMAQYLFRVLLRTEQRDGGIDIMIACNKADVFSMVPSSKLRDILQDELTDIRDAKVNSLGAVKNEDTISNKGKDGDDDDGFDDLADGSWLGTKGKIDFSKLEGQVSLADGSVTTNNVESWKRWIENACL